MRLLRHELSLNVPLFLNQILSERYKKRIIIQSTCQYEWIESHLINIFLQLERKKIEFQDSSNIKILRNNNSEKISIMYAGEKILVELMGVPMSRQGQVRIFKKHGSVELKVTCH